MIHASSSIELDEFELVEAAPGTALLRVAARTASPESQRPIHLLVQNGPDQHRLTPLPAAPDASGLLRVAFSAPSASMPGATFSLELPDGSVVALPAPRRARRIVQPGAPSQAQQDEAQAQGDELQALRNSAAEMAAQLDEAEARVEALADVVRRQTAAREVVIEQLERAEQARSEAEGTVNELRAQLKQLSARVPGDDPEAIQLRALELVAQERARVRALADVVAAGTAVAAGSSQLGT